MSSRFLPRGVDFSLESANFADGFSVGENMKRFLIAAVAASSIAGTTYAGGLDDPIVDGDVVEEDAAGSNQGILVPFFFLLLTSVTWTN